MEGTSYFIQRVFSSTVGLKKILSSKGNVRLEKAVVVGLNSFANLIFLGKRPVCLAVGVSRLVIHSHFYTEHREVAAEVPRNERSSGELRA